MSKNRIRCWERGVRLKGSYPYEQDYPLLFIRPQRMLKVIGSYLNCLPPKELFTYEMAETFAVNSLGGVNVTNWALLNALDHYLTMGWIMAANDHQYVACQDRMYIKC